MKYAQLAIGLLIGTALGGSVVAATDTTAGTGGGSLDKEAVKKIVRETIKEEPQVLVDSLQKYQESKRKQDVASASEALKDADVKKQIYDDTDVGTVGPKDSKRVIVEFFDYNCPACKMQYKAIDELVKKDKTVRVIFREFPIFGPVSENNSRIGIAVVRLAPEKYFAFYEKMHSHQGRAEEKDALKYVKELGLDVEKVKAESKKPEVQQALDLNRKLGDKLRIQGTPTLVIGDEIIPHAAGPDDLEEKLGK